MHARRIATALLWLPLTACSASTESVALGEREDAGPGSGGAPAVSAQSGGAVSWGGAGNGGASPPITAGPATREQFCNRAPGTGIAIPGTTDCTADLGKRTFLFGLCSCSDFNLSGVLRTDSFDSRRGITSQSGSVGVSGAFLTNSVFSIGGSLWASGRGVTAGPVVSSAGVNAIEQELHSGGDVGGSGFLRIGADTHVAGSLASPALTTTIGGSLYLPDGAATLGATVAGSVLRQPVTVPDPCNCDAPLDVNGIVQAFATSNDNGASGINPRSLATGLPGVTGAVGIVDITLDCGRYYFDRVNIMGATTVRLKGRTAIFVNGDFDVAGPFSLEFAPDAELDLFVAGNVSLTGVQQAFGVPGAPARFRMYVGGTRVNLSGVANLGVNLDARRALLTDSGALALWGSVYAREIGLLGSKEFHYDSAVLELDGCTPPGKECKDCHDCSGASPACKGGACGPCETSADCCAPLQCRTGACVPPSVIR